LMKSKAFVRLVDSEAESNAEFQLTELVIEKVEFVFIISTMHEYATCQFC